MGAERRTAIAPVAFTPDMIPGEPAGLDQVA
jgi:hypothetical protein